MNIVYGFNRIKTWKSNIDIPKADNVNDIAPHTEPAIRSSLSLGQSENPIARYDDLKRREKKKKQRSENEVFARLFDLVTTWMETEIRFQPPKTSITTIIKD